MATQLYLSGVSAISGGILDLNGANIELLPGWRPRVAKRRRGVLGGKRHEDVVESIPLRVYGASPADCVQFLELIAAAMDQARNWKDGAAVDAVILNYAINGTTLANPLQAAVWGTPADAADILELPVTFNQNLQVFEVNPVTLPLTRLGEWLGDEDEDTSSTVNNCEKMTVALSVVETVPAPTKVNMGVFSNTGDNRNWRGLIAVANSADGIFLYDAEDFGASGDWTVVADTANFARGDDIIIFTPTSTAEQSRNVINVSSGLDQSARLLAILFNARNSSVSDDFYVRFEVTGKLEQKSTDRVVVGAGETDPLWRLGGIVALDSGPTWVDLYVQPSGISSTPTIEIDTIAVVALDRGGGIVSIPKEQSGNNSFASDRELSIDHNFLTKPLPGVAMVGTPGLETTRGPISFQGSAAMYTADTDVTAVYLSTGGANSRHWRRSNNAGSAPQQFYAQVRRRPAYLVPR